MAGADRRIWRNAVKGSGPAGVGKGGSSLVDVVPASLDRLAARSGGEVRDSAQPMTSSWLVHCGTALVTSRGKPLCVDPVSVTMVPPPMRVSPGQAAAP